MVWVVVINDVRWTWVHTRMNPHSIIRDLEPLQCQRPSPYLIQEADPPTLPQPYYWVQKYPFIHQDRIMGCGKMNRYAAGVTTQPPQQSNTRQIDVIRQRSLGYFSSQIFLQLHLPLLHSGLRPFQRSSVFHWSPKQISECSVHCADWVRPSRQFSNSSPGETVLRTKGVGVRDHVGVEWIDQRSVVYKPLPHAPRTAVWLIFPVFKHNSGRQEVAITQGYEEPCFPSFPAHCAHMEPDNLFLEWNPICTQTHTHTPPSAIR